VEHTSKRSISKPALSMILKDHTLRVKADGDSAALSVILMMSDRAGIRASLDNRDAPRPRYQQPGSSLSLTCRYSTLASSHAGRAAWVALLLRPTSDMGMPRLVVHMSCDEPGIVTLELNDPSTLNAMTPELLLGLSFSVRAALLHESARGLVLQAAGPHFCTGGRYDAASQGKVPQWVHGSGLVLDRIRTAPLRSTSVLHGASIGGGLLLGLAADRRVCTPRAVLRLGVAPHGLSPIVRATDAVPRTVGFGVAAQMYLADHELDAQQALASGCVHRISSDAAAARRFARRDASASGRSVEATDARLIQETLLNGEASGAVSEALFVMLLRRAPPRRSLAAVAFPEASPPGSPPSSPIVSPLLSPPTSPVTRHRSSTRASTPSRRPSSCSG
jgi:enoyl-CoA hydratase/carnithine racemase